MNELPPFAPPPHRRRWPWGKKHTLAALLGGLLAVLLLFMAVSGFFAWRLSRQLAAVQMAAVKVQAAAKTQDLVQAQASLEDLKTVLSEVSQTYQGLAFWRLTPLAGYYRDGQQALLAAASGISAGEKLIGAIEPYADILGFQGEGSYTGGSAEDRVVKIIETAGLVAPVLDAVDADLAAMSQALAQIEPERYSFKFQGQPLSQSILKAQVQGQAAAQTVARFKPVLKQLPAITGLTAPKKYLVIFQNDGELRPTGGFMTAYSVMKVDKGKLLPEKSDDIYDLDGKFTQAVTPPDVLKKYLLTLRWNLRDMNLSPDFAESMRQFLSYYAKLPGEGPVDGVIAIDTQLLADLIKILGPIDVPGYGRFTADLDPRCQCPSIIYELEDISTRPTPYFRSERKAILGPMMGAILQKVYATDNQAWPQLFQTIWRHLEEKHVLFYFTDESAQSAAEGLAVAGRVASPSADLDYFMTVDANLGGAKSNIFTSQEVTQEIRAEPRQTSKTVTLVYKNPQKSSNCNLEAGQLCLNGKMPSWVRVYVPQGSTLIDAQGFEPDSLTTTSELGYTVFSGIYILQPESLAKIVLNYTVLYQPQASYQLQLQKQPGTKAPHYQITVNGASQSLDLIKDQTLTFPL
ncbi:hypothetical protein A2W24_05790 [Microgenomates group bacterium RBG_16_45_19]|nr:MAG: hypothetical protein A2W24_05790 [Microgenomates group bacterium RBG_16_45_19]